MAGINMTSFLPMRDYLDELWSSCGSLSKAKKQNIPVASITVPSPNSGHTSIFAKFKRPQSPDAFIKTPKPKVHHSTRFPQPENGNKSESAGKVPSLKIATLACFSKYKRKRKPEETKKSLKPKPSNPNFFTPTKKQTNPNTSSKISTTRIEQTLGAAPPKVYVLEGHSDDPLWLDQAQTSRSIDKSMLVSNITDADIIILAVGSMDDPTLVRRLSEIPDRWARVITVSRNFRLKGIPRDRCAIVTANPSLTFCGVSNIDTSTREKLPSYMPSRFTIGIIANNPQTAVDWVNQRRSTPECLQVDGHTITLVSNHKPGIGTHVDGYILVAEKHLETIELPHGSWPMVSVLKDPDMEILEQLANTTINTLFTLCRSDPLPCLVKRIIYRRLARRAKIFGAIPDPSIIR